ncbi:MAG: transposase [Methanomassiliicoccaceae archaeon]|nr:transposase [Methanomassiliicoccaceae archaeon]
MIRTVKYELPYDKALVDTVSIGTDVFRFLSDTAFEYGTSSKYRLNRIGYHVARKLFPSFSSKLIQTVRDTVCEARKAVSARTGEKNPIVNPHPGRGLRYDKDCFTMKNGRISIATVEGRKKYMVVPAPGYEGRTCRTATLRIKKGRIFLHCQYETETPPVKYWTEHDVVGIDRGIKNIVACSDNTIVNSKHLRNVKGKYRYNIARLQSKGTRSAKRRLIAMYGRERRFVTDTNHCLSKQLTGSRYGVFVFEDLTHIRKNSAKGKMGKKTRKLIGGWSFRQLETFVEYKAEALGKLVVYVDPRYTSQTCSCCGHIDKKNRNGASFHCLKCGFSLNSDLNASRNIADLGISVLGRVVSQAPQCSP